MFRSITNSSRVLTLLVCLCVPWSQALSDQWHFSDVERIVAIGDVHGAYDALVATLQEASVVDDRLAWSGGKAHLVFTGDLLDRGAKSRDVMDLVMRLEREAHRAGGRVHLLLGNHEVMNLTGDLRYVANEEYASFLDMESSKEREHWYRRFRRDRPLDSDELNERWEFDQKAPPGFFGHRKAFRHDGLYGKWLLKKPFIVVINETAFVHGGLPPYVAEQGLRGVNVQLKSHLREYVKMRARLTDADAISPIDPFKENPKLLAEIVGAGVVPDQFLNAAQRMIELTKSPLFWAAGPTWYRGTASCSALVEGDALNRVFAKIGASRVVMGHTSTVTRLVQQRMNGQVVEIDTGMLKSVYGGSGNALIIEGDELSVINEDGRKGLSLIEHPVRVGHGSVAITDAELADILATGTIIDSGSDGAVWRIVQVTKDEQTVFAYFREFEEAERVVPELAAYKLDRLLGLGMVPATVHREIADQQGIVQFIPPDAITERQRTATGRGKATACPLSKQIAAMYVFDTLINNQGRTPSSMIYSPDDWLLVLIDHEKSFGINSGRPEYLREIELIVGDEWREALLKLDDDVLHAELADVLDAARLAELAKRRDALLSH